MCQNVTTSFSELYKNCKQLINLSFDKNHLIEEEIDINSMTGLIIKSEYLTKEEFRENRHFKNYEKEGLDILHLNFRSLRSNYDHICDLISNLKVKSSKILEQIINNRRPKKAFDTLNHQILIEIFAVLGVLLHNG